MKKRLLSLILVFFAYTLIAQDVTPSQNGDKYSLSTGDLYFEIDASFGAQVSSLKVDGAEILYYGGGANEGSTFWPSPQSAWGWPPSTQLDNDSYAAQISGNSIIAESTEDPASQLVFKKTFTANSASKTVTLKYEIKNQRTSAYSVAGWEVTRVPSPGGLTFFPAGDGSVTGDFAPYTELNSGVVWYDQDAADPSSMKFFSDGSEGWLAHVNSDNYLFVKTFEDVPSSANAPGEEEVEFWHDGPTTYIELENQSGYESVPASGSLFYTVTWFAEKLPTEVNVSVGSADLLSYVRALINPTSIDAVRSQEDLISIYPNPVSDYLKIQSDLTGLINLDIYDITGKLIVGRDGLGYAESVDLSLLEEGIYIYSIRIGETHMTGKFIKK